MVRVLTLLGCLLALTQIALGAEYYLSPTGKDDDPGSRERPWRTITRANAAAQAGDTVTFLPGRYEGCLEPANSGTDLRPLTFRAATPHCATLTGGRSSDGAKLCLRLKDRRHVVVDGLDLRPENGGAWWLLEGCEYVTLRNGVLQGGAGVYVPAQSTGCRYCRFEGLDISRALQVDTNGHVGGNMFQLNNCSRNVIQDCRFGRAGHDPFCLWIDCTYNVVRRCVFDCRWGRNFEFFTSPHTLIEQCLITNGYHGSGSADGRAKLFLWEGIFRHNVIFRNWYQPLTIHAYKYEQMDPFGMIDSRLYHNTFVRNYESGFEMFDIAAQPDPHMVRGNVLQNNLFAFNDPDGDGLALDLAGNIAPDNRFVLNLFCGNTPGEATIGYAWPAPPADGRQSSLRTAAEANAALPEQFAANADGDPKLVSVDRDDYRLSPGSPARDAGRPLATTTAGGAGTEVPVTDVRPFYDGWGIPGETGDLVMVGPRKQSACVVKADLDRGVLALDRPVKWATGQAVSLPYTGSAPDIGAYELGAENEPWYAGPKVPAGLRIETMETATEPIVVTDFEAENLEEWFFHWYTHRQRGCEAHLDDTTAASGKRSLCIEATEDKANLGALLRPAWWDIDRFPTVTFSYRIPQGVPVGVWLYPMAAERRQWAGVCLGGSPARNSGPGPDLKKCDLLDDDQWHTVTLDVRAIREALPDVKLLKTFYFRTNDNATQGQRYWFDSFRIAREP